MDKHAISDYSQRMPSQQLARVRSFNRMVTEAIGALDQRFLGRDRPLGAARLLWEIGSDDVEIRSLRRRLGLDSGYCSRLLRSLERDGLVSVTADQADGRVRRVRLTDAGQVERAELDRRSDDQAQALLDPLSPADRARLVGAMADVERLLARARTSITEEPADSADVARCFAAYFGELDARFEAGFDVRRSNRADVADLKPPAGFVLLARIARDPVGCGAGRLHADGVAELKRMWVARRSRGLGLGGRILTELERRAAARGATVARLETNHSLTEAIAMYRRAGYREVKAFNDEPYADHWFEKRL